MKKLIILGLIVLAVSCSNDDKKTADNKPQQTSGKNSNGEVFNAAFAALMNDYYHLKDNFITESDTIINVYAKKLMADADSLPLASLQSDTLVISTAKTTVASISAELQGLLGEKDIEAKRKSFALVSEEMYDLIRTVQYDKAVVYHAHCPMAFNGNGANWLTNTADIKNPYIPIKMLSCGTITDSLNFAKK